MMILEHHNYRTFLKSVYIDRAKKNSKYSLRAFAQLLGISHSTLSQVLNGQRNLSKQTGADIASKLKLSDRDTEYLCLLIEIEATKKAEMKGMLISRLNKMRPKRSEIVSQFSVDYFKVIADWYHFSILQLFKIKGFVPTPSTISKVLGVSKVEVELAIERLKRVGILDEVVPGKYEVATAQFRVHSEEKNEALQKFHIQHLEKAIAAFKQQDPSERLTGSETFALSKSGLAQVRKLTANFLTKTSAIAAKDSNPEEVYHCQVNLFRTSNLKGEKI